MGINYQNLPVVLANVCNDFGLSRFNHIAFRRIRTGHSEKSADSYDFVKQKLLREIDYVISLSQYPEDGGQVFTATVIAMPASQLEILLLAAYNAGKEAPCSGI